MKSLLGELINKAFIDELKEYEVTFKFQEMFSLIMKNKGITKTELAKRMGVNKSHITNLFQQDNITTKTISSIMSALNEDLYISTSTQQAQIEKEIRREYSKTFSSASKVTEKQGPKVFIKRKKKTTYRKKYALQMPKGNAHVYR